MTTKIIEKEIKMIKKSILFLSILITFNFISAQSYFYKTDIHKEGFGKEEFLCDIIKVDLETGDTTKIFNDIDGIILSDISKILLNTDERKICVYDAKTEEIDTLEFFKGKYDLWDAYLVPYESESAIVIRAA